MIKGLDLLNAALNQFDLDIKTLTGEAVKNTTAKVRSIAVRSIAKQSQGDKKVKRGKKYHVVSKEGDAPNTDTGRLIGSIKQLHLGQIGFVYTDLNYGLILETVHNRPYLEPALNEGKAGFGKAMSNAIKRAINERNH